MMYKISDARPRAFTLIEVMIALTILSVGILGLVISSQASMTITESNRCEAIAMDFARQQLAMLEGDSLKSGASKNIVSKFYKQLVSGNPYPVAISTLATLNVTPLPAPADTSRPWANLPPGATYSILFPTDGALGTNGNLVETGITNVTALQANAMGMSPTGVAGQYKLDMQGDGTFASGTIATSSIVMLPVCVNVSWKDVTGSHEVNVYGLLSNLKP